MARKPKTRSLAIYLLKAREKDPTKVVDATGCTVETIQVASVTGHVLLKQTRAHPPGWASFLQPGMSAAQLSKLSTASASALLVLKAGGRLFALAFGHGRHMLVPGCFEEQFGLKVCLNAIEPGRVRSIDRKSFEAGVRQGREQVSRDAAISDFGLNIEQDLLRAVTGTPRHDLALGTRISGMDSLLIHVPLNLDGLPRLLQRLVALFADDAYKELYPWVEHITEVRDVETTSRLDTALVAELNENNLDNAWMAVPEIVEWDRISGFSYSPATDAPIYPDLHLRELLRALPQPVTIDRLRKARVFRRDADGSVFDRPWSAYECLYAERGNSGMHILSGGSWFAVELSYAKSVASSIAALKSTKCALPTAQRNEKESAYNARAAGTNTDYLLLDQKLVRLPGRVGPIEICDILARSVRCFLHVKRWGQSAVLSHLFAQGLVSADLFLHDNAYRTEMRKRIPGTWVPRTKPDAPNYEVAYVLLSASKKKLRLPFFSQVNLRSCVDRLHGFGFTVTLAKVQVV